MAAITTPIWLDADTYWGSPPPTALGEIFKLVCPVCAFDYTHLKGTTHVDGQDHYKAWMGRGDLTRISFWSECGHHWDVCFGFHKGNMFVYAEAAKDTGLPFGGDDANVGDAP